MTQEQFNKILREKKANSWDKFIAMINNPSFSYLEIFERALKDDSRIRRAALRMKKELFVQS